MKALTNNQKLGLILKDLEQWVQGGNSDDSMSYAFRHGYRLHAANLWLSTGAISPDVEALIKGVKINQRKESAEVKALLKEAHVYICADCNHHAFLDADEGESVRCLSCLKTAKRDGGPK